MTATVHHYTLKTAVSLHKVKLLTSCVQMFLQQLVHRLNLFNCVVNCKW